MCFNNKYIRKALNYFSIITLLSGFMLVGVYMYWTLYPYKILDVRSVYGVQTKTVKQGDMLVFKRNVEKLHNIDAEVNCSFVDGLVYNLPSRRSTTTVGYDNTTQAVIVPSTLPVGIYKYTCKLDFQVNPIRTVSYTITTDTFEVIK